MHITDTMLTLACNLLRELPPHTPKARASLISSLEKARVLLPTLAWEWDEHILRIQSASEPEESHFVEDVETCDCEGARRWYCWHRAAYMILHILTATGQRPQCAVPWPKEADDDEEDEAGYFIDTAEEDETTSKKPAPLVIDKDWDASPVLIGRTGLTTDEMHRAELAALTRMYTNAPNIVRPSDPQAAVDQFFS